MILFDTNVLVYVHNKSSPNHPRAFKLESEVLEGRLEAAVSTQNLLEFYTTITNHTRVSEPLEPREANKVINDYLKSPFQIIHPRPSAVEKTFYLSTKMNISGAKIFDVYLVATMLSNNISTVYTNNEKHFKMFEGVRAINPFK